MAKGRIAIVQEGSPVLRGKAKPVLLPDIGSKHVREVVLQMKHALAGEADGVAIAAPQIGVPLRIFVVARNAFVIANEEKRRGGKAVALTTAEKDLTCINPEITKLSKKKVKLPEGCLSVRWTYGNTLRHEKVTLHAYDEHGKRFTYGGSGLIAQIFQHETDHLNGTLFTDHATDLETLTPEQIAEIEEKQKKQHGK
ncbi:MAG: peptide deformylase [Candidatus Lloydbacteria bacterium RIFCSPHIGHO2_02_FULL_54_17]|uniref:Peptide deformylase n=1 Tax=Candidatus Lloydbacteria bacterium RIFCSPHIGHO2_02_FULL_54_17 TaxID=1798664 RepID=A0A1G2DF49_9BACT|nr:MAG: peptide deformylase [Candidatus Lloydbacteria bacterium RIFCSPHIGHO2_01_FULL_54_11]OGZ11418.1 MAG: peptide deformylase [Candidatus Lloydbacteria bacterium RIFCSPHIGHO2_02_FULL_54_17]OGZ13712.1 MAG: peptide deformylase [Candidatus Lloydbacteria bacterium RIFCSPLOWO2_01_FULL_54_18]OGZ15438.1 MAG: peptide deformylase [Candidatus Lloydbacteria bacterium RIFCSPLOWO2_02_FULL_54_12]